MLSKDKKEWFDLPTIEKHDNDFKDKKFDKKMALGLLNEVQVHWCGDCDNYKHSGCGCYFPSFKKEMIKKINEHFEVLDVIEEEVDDIQTVIDLLDSKVVTMGHINIAIKKLEIIQDKLMGVEEDAE
jgi:hypothetical protein|nr:MAG TPA: hypothetical protein [Caudoviricetes sp.]